MDLSKLQGHIPNNLIEELRVWAAVFGLNTNLRLAHFLAQIDIESARFKKTEENLNYSEKRLIEVFPGRFNESNAVYYARKPIKIANRAYANKGGNRNEASGDGHRFRGRGYLQLTLADNYVAFGEEVKEDLVKNPDLVKTKYPLTSALWYFKVNRIWAICDRGTNKEVVEAVTGKINRAKLHLKERTERFNVYIKILEIV